MFNVIMQYLGYITTADSEESLSVSASEKNQTDCEFITRCTNGKAGSSGLFGACNNDVNTGACVAFADGHRHGHYT